MRLHVLALVGIIIFAISCKSKGDNAAKASAEKVIDALTPERLNTFGQWAFSGQGNVWYKGSIEQVETTARYEERNDSLILAVRKPEAFINDFELDIPIDSRLHGLTLIQSVDTCIFISEDALIGGYRWTTLDCSMDTVFKRGNPFSFFKDLTRFKDSLGIQGIEHPGDKIIQLYLTDGWVLTYLPNGSAAGLEKRQQDEPGRGEKIRDNWYLRRNDEHRPTP